MSANCSCSSGHGHCHDEPFLTKEKIIRFILGGIFFIFALFALSFWPRILLFGASYILIGGDILLTAIKNIRRGQIFDENFLMALASLGAFAIGEYAEGVAVIIFYQVGEFFQGYAVDRSRKSITSLMDIRPDYANIKQGDIIRQVPPDQVKLGDCILIKPGEKVPLDGVITEGFSSLDNAALTGESLPKDVSAGDLILSGAINISGVLTVTVTKSFGESTVSKILELVQNASSKKAPMENFITKFARYYTPAVVGLAAFIAIVPPLLLPAASFSDWLYRALIFLVASCPCALVLSIPLSFFGGIGGASRKGILVKGGNYLEALNKADTIIFDKTGTLTKGSFKVVQVEAQAPITPDQLLEIAAYAESYSNHPIALSIVATYEKSIDKSKINQYEEIPGNGIKARLAQKIILAGNEKLMEREHIDRSGFTPNNATGTMIHIAQDGIYAGYILIADEIKEDSKDAIKQLREMGCRKLVMLTGDNKQIGTKIGNDLGLDHVYCELLPAQKVEMLELLEKEKKEKSTLVFVGDGINDAPVLTRADIGIAMGGVGSDAAIEAADIVIMTDEPSKIPIAMQIARKTNRIVWQNIALAMGVKLIVLILGVGGIATMWEAVFADVGVALLAILNTMRLIRN